MVEYLAFTWGLLCAMGMYRALDLSQRCAKDITDPSVLVQALRISLEIQTLVFGFLGCHLLGLLLLFLGLLIFEVRGRRPRASFTRGHFEV